MFAENLQRYSFSLNVKSHFILRIEEHYNKNNNNIVAIRLAALYIIYYKMLYVERAPSIFNFIYTRIKGIN